MPQITFLNHDHKAVGTENEVNWKKIAGLIAADSRLCTCSAFAKPLRTVGTGRWSRWSPLWLWSAAFQSQFQWTNSTGWWWCQVRAVAIATGAVAPERIWKSRAQKFFVVSLHFFGSTRLQAQLAVLMSAFVMVSTVWSVSCLLIFYTHGAPCPAICKGGARDSICWSCWWLLLL